METVKGKLLYPEFCEWAREQNWLEISDEVGTKRFTTWLTPLGLKVKVVFDGKGFTEGAASSMSVNRV